MHTSLDTQVSRTGDRWGVCLCALLSEGSAEGFKWIWKVGINKLIFGEAISVAKYF